jgi:hypothetical protein
LVLASVLGTFGWLAAVEADGGNEGALGFGQMAAHG